MRLDITADDVRPIVQEAVDQVLAKLAEDCAALGDNRLCYSEVEAAAMLGIRSKTLRDFRLNGKIRGTRLGRSVFYTRAALLRFLRDNEEGHQ